MVSVVGLGWMVAEQRMGALRTLTGAMLIAAVGCGNSGGNPDSHGTGGAGAHAGTGGQSLGMGGSKAGAAAGQAGSTGGSVSGSGGSAGMPGGGQGGEPVGGADQGGSAGGPPAPECTEDAECEASHADNLCQGTWWCDEGSCALDESSAVDCSGTLPQDECHDVACAPATGTCEQVATLQARDCGADYCSLGQCSPGTGQCVPDVSCPSCATCNVDAGACVAKADACLIDGVCKALGALKEKDGCLACGEAKRNEWSPLEVGSTCKLTDTCFTSFACNAEGACQGAVPKTPAIPRPMRPISGTRTGSVWAPAARATLRPKFVWADVNDNCAAVKYHFQLVGGCTTSADCDFDDPEIDEPDLSGVTYQPAADLGASVVAPVGSRYHWRVRACRGISCSAWSSTRYVDVGRVPHDYNGDGYTDVAIAAAYQYKVAVAYGSSSGPAAPVQIALDRKVSPGTTGDVNGDGFSDLLLFSWQDNLTPPGRYYGYFGSAAGLPAQPQWESIRITAGYAITSFSTDFSNDGYDDLVMQSYDPFPTSADYFAGSAGGLPSTRTSYLTGQMPPPDRVERMTTGDVNADAIPDLVAAAGWFARVHVWNSNGSGLPTTASDIVPTLISTSSHPDPIAVGDANGDHQDDLFHALVRSLGYSYGVLYHFRAQGGGYPDQPTQVFPDSTHATTDNYGTDIVGGQLVGQDGLFDFAVSAPRTLPGGTIYVYESSKLQSTQPILLNNPNGDEGYGYGSPLQVPGDLNGDGNDDLIVCDRDYQDDGGALYYYGPITAQSTVGGYIERPADFATFCDILL